MDFKKCSFKKNLFCVLCAMMVMSMWFMPSDFTQYFLQTVLVCTVSTLVYEYWKVIAEWGSAGFHALKKIAQKMVVFMFLSVILPLIPVITSVYLVLCIVFIAWPISWIWKKAVVRITGFYYKHIHGRFMSVVKWVNNIFSGCFCITSKVIAGALGLLFVYATCGGFLSLIVVKSMHLNTYFSTSMEVRNCTTHVRFWTRMDNVTYSQTHLAQIGIDMGTVFFDQNHMVKRPNETLWSLLWIKTLMYVRREVSNAKFIVEDQENDIQIIKELIKRFPDLEYFGNTLQYFPYLICFFTHKNSARTVCTFFTWAYIVLYMWLLVVRYYEYGLWYTIFHWNTFRNGIYISFVYVLYRHLMLWMDKRETVSQELERAASPPRDASRRSARAKSPGRRALRA
jgi:hypothetical protein